jgi:xylulokinase
VLAARGVGLDVVPQRAAAVVVEPERPGAAAELRARWSAAVR